MNIPRYIIVHHTGGSNTNPLQDSSSFTFEQCNEQHKKDFNFISSLGYFVGYHYYIEKDGKVTQARKDDEEGAHTKGYNSNSIGICLAGNFDLTLPTLQQKEALSDLLIAKTFRYNIAKDNIVPHRHFAQKSCYGNLLGDSWARALVYKEEPIPLTREEKITKATELLKEAANLLKDLQ